MVHTTRMSKSPVGPIIDRINRKRTSEAGGPGPSHSQTQHEAGTSQCQPTSETHRSTCVVRARGPSLGLKTWRRAGVPINIESNEWDQPIGDDSVELETHLGVLARNNQLAPLTFNDWRAVPLDLKQLMWSEIEKKFNPSIHLKKHIFKSIGKKWKDYKSRLKAAYYDSNLSIMERVANLPPRVHEDQWFIINQFWDSEKGKKRGEIGRANRSQLQMSHTAGRKSFARIRASEKMKRSGLDPSRAEMFRLTHIKKNQQPVDLKSAEILAQLSSRELNHPESSRVAASRGDSLSQVLGEDRHGYVRTFGLGPSPSDVFGPQPTRMDYKRMADHAIKSSEERVHVMEEQMSGMQKTIEEMTMQIQSMKMAMENMSSVRVNATQHLDCSDSFPPNSSQMYGMQQTIEEMTSQMQTMQSTIKSLQAFNVKQPTMPSALFKSAPDKSTSNAQGMCPQKQSHLNQPSSSTQLNMRGVLKRKKKLEVKKTAMRVDLLSFEAPGEVVAQGRVVSKDPNKDVGGFKLGPHFWEVYVEIAIREEEFLIRPRGHLSTIKEVVGSTIAWPSSKVNEKDQSSCLL